jgi:hypothetical protein
MRFNRGFISYYRQHYPAGAAVELISTDMPHRDMPAGLMGIILKVSEDCRVHCIWENGNSLALIPGFDEFRAVNEREYSMANNYSYQLHEADYGDLEM